MTVQDLRSSGYKVKVLHHRMYNGKYTDNSNFLFKDLKPQPDAKGGYTKIIIHTPDGTKLEGKAVCNIHDNYDKKLGVRIAIGRALSDGK